MLCVQHNVAINFVELFYNNYFLCVHVYANMFVIVRD